MLEVYHYPLCPFSRKLRILLKEMNIAFGLFTELYWLRKPAFLKMNVAGETPVIIREDKKIFSGNNAIFEYLNECYPEKSLLTKNLDDRAEIRRVSEWFDIKFFNEVTRYILNEKIIKTIARGSAPNSQAIQAAKKNIYYHLDYIAFLLKDHYYLCSDEPTLADFSAAAQLSVLDFVGDVPWSHNQAVKSWYALIKSRPSFKPLLYDKLSNFSPPKYYNDPDF